MRIHNFSAGPSVLPESVLQQASAEMMDYGGFGMSVMEMSHRSKAFQQIIDQTHQHLVTLLDLPKQYKILFLQGGATTQFSAVPLNLMVEGRADYVDTGSWSTKAIKEAERYGRVHVTASSKADRYRHIPKLTSDRFSQDADYVHITTNNTIFGTAFHQTPDCGAPPLVADMSSDIFSRPIDVAKYGVIYAGAQKNAGCAGMTLVIIREDLIGRARSETPLMLDYATHAAKGSMYNTPPTWSIYIAGLVYQWLLEQGGLAAMEQRNREKADLLYNFLDQSSVFTASVAKEDRSWMNIPFSLPDEEMDAKFISASQDAGFANLKGHRSTGGMRASLYNALPRASVEALVGFMADFEKKL